jgi:uncharacterized DUF497 family protein
LACEFALGVCQIDWIIARNWCTLKFVFDFKWIEWNIDHIARHGVEPEEAEWVVNHAHRPYPERTARDKYVVRGQTETGQYLEVVYVIEPDDRVFVITARPLKDNEKRRYRRRRS